MTWYTCIYLTNNEDCFTRWVCFIYIPGLVLFLLLIKAISLCLRGVSKALGGSSCEFFAYVKINESPLHFSLTVFLWSSIKKALDKIAIIKALRNDRRIGEENEYFLVGLNTMICYKSCGKVFFKGLGLFISKIPYQLNECLLYGFNFCIFTHKIIFKGGLWFIMYECTRKAALYIQVFVSSIDKQQSWYFCLRCLFSIPTLWRVWGSATVQLLGSSLTRRICTLQDIASIIII